jgi:hypothetical protein
MIVGSSLSVKPYVALYTSQVIDANITASSSTAQGRTETVLDFNSGDGVYARDLATAFSWPISAGTILYTWQPTLVELPENTYNRATDWDNAGTPGNKLVRGFILELDTFNAAKQVIAQRVEDLAFFTPSESPATTNKQVIKAFSFNPPFVSHNLRITSTDSVPWRNFGVKWIVDPWPEYATLRSAWSDLGAQGAKYIRGLVLPMDTKGVSATINIATSDGGSVTFTATTPAAVKTPIAFAFVPPIIAHDVQIQVQTATAGVWVEEARWDFDPYPEIIPEYTPIMELSGPDNKFFQGVKLIGDTGNNPVTFQILYDGGQTGPTFTGTFNGKQTLIFSWTPFLAHDIQLVPQGNARVWWGGVGQGQSEWCFQPFAEASTLWQTELTSLGGVGFQHLRLINVEYISTASATMSFVVDTGNGSYAPASITIPSSGGTQTKWFTQVSPNKWKIISFKVTSSAPITIFQEGFEVWTRSWGSSSEYSKQKPFAGPSAPGAIV